MKKVPQYCRYIPTLAGSIGLGHGSAGTLISTAGRLFIYLTRSVIAGYATLIELECKLILMPK